MSDKLFVGVDIGTSGVRAIAIDERGIVQGQAATPMPTPERDGAAIFQAPEIWWQAVSDTLSALTASVSARAIRALAVDGTSGTLLLTDAAGNPVTRGLMYNDASCTEQAGRIKQTAPPESACHGASSPLARLLYLQAQTPGAWHALHQADWIVDRLTSRYGVSDENNMLKLGYDVVARRWPNWFDALGGRGESFSTVATRCASAGRTGYTVGWRGGRVGA